MKLTLMIILGLVGLVSVTAAAPDGGTQSPFTMGTGARELSLGGAALARCDASTAPIWNASRLANAEYYSISGFHTRLFDSDASLQYLGLVAPTLDFGVFALGLSRLGIKGIEKRDAGNLLIDEFDDSRLALNFAYAKIISNYQLGLNLSVEHHSLDTYSANSTPGLSLSIGRQFDFNTRRLEYLAFAINGVNLVQPTMKLVEESISYPYEIQAGLSIGLKPLPNKNHRLMLAAAVVKVDYIDPRLNAGIEYDFDHLLFLRGGVRNKKLSFGAGIEYKKIRFDYALVDRDLGSLHMFTLTTVFGSSVSTRRAERIQKRETEFDSLMDQRLTSRNREMVDQLTKAGQDMLAEGKLVDAADNFDRALFLARSSGLDTIQISVLADENSRRLDEITRETRYSQYLDSARAMLSSNDYLSAVRLVNLARAEKPASPEALAILQKATEAIERTSTLAETVRRGLQQSDSLLSYGHINQALEIAIEMTRLIPDDDRVQQLFKKTSFEFWKATAISALSAEDHHRANQALDSALSLFPGHQWCLQMQKQITADIQKPVGLPEKAVSAAPRRLNPDMQKQVELAYQAAREHFKKGDLTQAIEQWEIVRRIVPDYQSVRRYLLNAYKFVGVDLYGQNRLEEAVAAWRKAAEMDPENAEIRGYIRRTEAEIRKLSELSYDH